MGPPHRQEPALRSAAHILAARVPPAVEGDGRWERKLQPRRREPWPRGLRARGERRPGPPPVPRRAVVQVQADEAQLARILREGAGRWVLGEGRPEGGQGGRHGARGRPRGARCSRMAARGWKKRGRRRRRRREEGGGGREEEGEGEKEGRGEGERKGGKKQGEAGEKHRADEKNTDIAMYRATPPREPLRKN